MSEACPSTSHASSPKYLRLRSIPTEATKPAFLPNLTPVTRPAWSEEKGNWREEHFWIMGKGCLAVALGQ